eukprot:TRINITY_DN2508_c0_g1_i1.p1 TRINITY_DN2508_c0_g1~~TRINITY_DN2508_c0_g1_i1.p1  ORF type:complete len:268 (-),score=37.12 TRINITY_DN2508_c0_g1_i1:72-875(-)
MAFTTGRYIAFLAAASLFIAGLLRGLLNFGVIGTPPPLPANSTATNQGAFPDSLDPDYLQALWAYRAKIAPTELSINFFLSVGLFTVMMPMGNLCKIYRGQPSFFIASLGNCATLGAVLPVFEFLQNLGSSAAGDYIFSTWNLTLGEVQALEISYLMSISRSLWVFAMVYAFMGMAFACYVYMNLRANILPRAHGWLALLNCGLCVVCFILDIVTFLRNKLSVGFGVLSLLWSAIFFPIFLIWLGVLLGRTKLTKASANEATMEAHL